MQLIPVGSNTAPLEFQQPLKGPPDEQDNKTLPLEILEHIGRMCPDVPTAITFTRTCRLLYLSRPKILTGHLPKLQWTIQKLVSHQHYLALFLDHCTTSPFRNAAFEIAGSSQKDKDLITAVMPHVKVNLPGFIENVGRVMRGFEELFNAQQVLRGVNVDGIIAANRVVAGINGRMAAQGLWRPRGFMPQPAEHPQEMFERAQVEDIDLYDLEQLERAQADVNDMINNIHV
ncbi:MAG: hypothetical protein LLF94_09125 [Chlamydiales bacterium]|nr:hypothetical protein [Chlamydiales bacterium]